MDFRIITSRQFDKDFSRLDSETQFRILKYLEKVKIDPFKNTDIKKLTNVDFGKYRIRIGDYRIRFDIDDHNIYLLRVGHRREAYRE